jgi:DNA-binding transcriptional ArsR family regulator
MKEAGGRMDELSTELLDRMAGTLKILAHPHRLKIVEILQLTGEAPVHAIVGRLNLPQATISQHLNQMRRVGLVKARREGKEVWYSIADPSSLTILDCIRKKQGGRGPGRAPNSSGN